MRDLPGKLENELRYDFKKYFLFLFLRCCCNNDFASTSLSLIIRNEKTHRFNVILKQSITKSGLFDSI